MQHLCYEYDTGIYGGIGDLRLYACTCISTYQRVLVKLPYTFHSARCAAWLNRMKDRIINWYDQYPYLLTKPSMCICTWHTCTCRLIYVPFYTNDVHAPEYEQSLYFASNLSCWFSPNNGGGTGITHVPYSGFQLLIMTCFFVIYIPTNFIPTHSINW